MQILSSSERVPIKGFTEGVLVEEEALKQLKNLAQLPFLHKHVAVMPDVHAGKGSTIGSVIVTKGAIIPAAVGVDIGCGMMAIQTNIKASQLPDNLFNIRSAIEAAVPHGRTDNGGLMDRGAWGNADRKELLIPHGLSQIIEKHAKLEKAAKRAPFHIGTLGTGNHFIELCLDENHDVWIMLHSGSRGIGNAIGMYFIELAKQEMRRFFINLPDMDLSYLPEGSFYYDDYMQAVQWAQSFARANREVMMKAVIKAVSDQLGLDITPQEVAVNCHHNYVEKEHHFGSNVLVTRKGAVRAREGDLGIIPGSMGTKSFIVRGKGNAESFHSCSHGAGRAMSRTKAEKIFTVEDHIRATEGVECRKDVDVIDETPLAYKDIDAVMYAQRDLVEVVHTLKQVVCVKG
jgi:tRNA-splicing ligase RtcB